MRYSNLYHGIFNQPAKDKSRVNPCHNENLTHNDAKKKSPHPEVALFGIHPWEPIIATNSHKENASKLAALSEPPTVCPGSNCDEQISSFFGMNTAATNKRKKHTCFKKRRTSTNS